MRNMYASNQNNLAIKLKDYNYLVCLFHYAKQLTNDVEQTTAIFIIFGQYYMYILHRLIQLY